MFRSSTLSYMEKKSVIARYAYEFFGVLRQKGVVFDGYILSGSVETTKNCIGIKCYCPDNETRNFMITGMDIMCIPPDVMAFRIWLVLPKGRDRRKGFSFI